MASPVRSIPPRLEPTASPRQLLTLTNHLLEEIFLRVASHADLARASAACVSFRRLIADPNFHRRYRSRHPPLLLGFLGTGREVFQHMEAPHPNAPVSRALGRAGGFSFDYVPNGGDLGWALCDVSDGRLLLEGSPPSRVHGNDANSFAWPDLAVCDPLFRQYLLLPRIPEDLLASVQIEGRDVNYFDDSLVPSGDWEDASFRVLRMIQSSKRLVACVFSSTSSCWSVSASTSLDVPSLDMASSRPQFAYGCCYWETSHQNKLLKLDMETMEFSTIGLPPDHDKQSFAIVEAGEGNLGMLSLIYDDIGGTSVLAYYIYMRNVSGRANEWNLKNTTPMARYSFGFIGSAGGYVFLAHKSSRFRYEYVYSSLDIRTFNIERVSRTRNRPGFCYPCFGFPPSMSPRRIQGFEVL